MLGFAGLLLAGIAPADEAPQPAAAPDHLLTVAAPTLESPEPPAWQLVIKQQIIIRVPARPSPLANFSATPAPAPRKAPPPLLWKETKAPKCVAMRNILGMQAVQRDSIDLITRQNQRLRAQLSGGCRALDFYAGFYMKANEDGQLCEDRDEIHARTGAKCEVDKFRLLVPIRNEE